MCIYTPHPICSHVVHKECFVFRFDMYETVQTPSYWIPRRMLTFCSEKCQNDRYANFWDGSNTGIIV